MARLRAKAAEFVMKGAVPAIPFDPANPFYNVVWRQPLCHTTAAMAELKLSAGFALARRAGAMPRYAMHVPNRLHGCCNDM